MRDYSATWPWLLLVGVLGVLALPGGQKAPKPMPVDAADAPRPKPSDPEEGGRLPSEREHPLRPHAEFLGIPPEKADSRNFAGLRTELKRHRCEVSFLIVTVPDPADPDTSRVIREFVAQAGVEAHPAGHGYKLIVPMRSDRQQAVYVGYVGTDPTGRPIIALVSVCGPTNQRDNRSLLKLNAVTVEGHFVTSLPFVTMTEPGPRSARGGFQYVHAMINMQEVSEGGRGTPCAKAAQAPKGSCMHTGLSWWALATIAPATSTIAIEPRAPWLGGRSTSHLPALYTVPGPRAMTLDPSWCTRFPRTKGCGGALSPSR